MKKTLAVFLCVVLLTLSACTPAAGEEYSKEYYKIDMNTNYLETKELPDGNGRSVRVVLLLGQSNASGCSVVQCLQENLPAE